MLSPVMFVVVMVSPPISVLSPTLTVLFTVMVSTPFTSFDRLIFNFPSSSYTPMFLSAARSAFATPPITSSCSPFFLVMTFPSSPANFRFPSSKILALSTSTFIALFSTFVVTASPSPTTFTGAALPFPRFASKVPDSAPNVIGFVFTVYVRTLLPSASPPVTVTPSLPTTFVSYALKVTEFPFFSSAVVFFPPTKLIPSLIFTGVAAVPFTL